MSRLAQVFYLLGSLALVWGAAPNTPMGANIYQYTEAIFVNVVRQSNFGSGPVDSITEEPRTDSFCAVVSEGSCASTDYGNWTITFNGPPGVYFYPGSLYAASWTQLSLDYDNDTGFYVGVFSESANGCPRVDPCWENCNAQNGTCYNISIIRPGYDWRAPPMFTNEFLAFFKGFNTYRYMDLTNANNDARTNLTWAHRSSPLGATWLATSQDQWGVPYEMIIELSNLAQVNPWVNIPIGVTEDYLIGMANLFKEKLDPKLILWVEWGNEVWNYGLGFEAAFALNVQLAQQEVAANTTMGKLINYDNSNNLDLWARRRVALKSKEVSDAFRSVYGDCAINKNVRILMPTQLLSIYAFPMMYYNFGPLSDYFYAWTTAPYWSCDPVPTNASDAVQCLKDQLPQYGGWPAFHNELATLWGLRYVSYEAADVFFDFALGAALETEPGYVEVLEDYLGHIFGYGTELLNWYSVGASWVPVYATSDDISNPHTARMRAMQSFFNKSMEDIPLAPHGLLLPQYNLPGFQFDSAEAIAAYNFFWEPSTFGGLYQLSVPVEVGISNLTININVDGPKNTVATWTFDQSAETVTKTMNVNLTAGFHTIQFLAPPEFRFMNGAIINQSPYGFGLWNVTLVQAYTSAVLPPRTFGDLRYLQDPCLALTSSSPSSNVESTHATIPADSPVNQAVNLALFPAWVFIAMLFLSQ